MTRRYVVDYLSDAYRDIFVTEEGSYTQRFVYNENGVRVTAEFGYAPNTRRGEGGENLQSDIAVGLGKIWYKNSQIGTAMYAVDSDCKTVSHMIYDVWGEPQRGTYTDTNLSGIDALANFTGYTWDEVLDLYFAQNRFYDPADHRFTQEDIIKDSLNWYAYCDNNPTLRVDPWGLDSYIFYDADLDKGLDMDKYVQMYVDELKAIFNTEVHTFTIESRVKTKNDWNSMDDGWIDAVIFLEHGSWEKMAMVKKNDGIRHVITGTLFDGFDQKNIGYFFLLGCHLGEEKGDKNGTNMAMEIMSTKQNINMTIALDRLLWLEKNNTSVLASEEYTEYDSTTKEKIRQPVIPPEGQGFKLYEKDLVTGDIKSTILGNQFESFTDLLNKAKEKHKENLLLQALDGLARKYMFGRQGYVETENLRLRNGAGMDFAIKGMVHDGDKFQISEVTIGDGLIWYKVKMTSGSLSGEDGYIASKYTRLE